MCYSTALLRVFSVQGKATNSDWQVYLGSPLWDCTTGRVDDDDPSGASTYAKIRNLANGYAKDQQIVGQRFDRGYDVEAADLKTSGDITNVLVGLQPDTKYGNWNYDSNGWWTPLKLLVNLARKDNPGPDPLSALYSGLHVTFKDGSTYDTDLLGWTPVTVGNLATTMATTVTPETTVTPAIITVAPLPPAIPTTPTRRIPRTRATRRTLRRRPTRVALFWWLRLPVLLC